MGKLVQKARCIGHCGRGNKSERVCALKKCEAASVRLKASARELTSTVESRNMSIIPSRWSGMPLVSCRIQNVACSFKTPIIVLRSII